MKDFFLNFTKILETNSKIYWSIIVGIVGCLILYIAEIVHIQNVLVQMSGQDTAVIRTVIDPIAQGYQWSRIALIILALVWSNVEYRKTKKSIKKSS
ncbi:hypothetical protein [Acinetobacter sp.]|uniref:hypothetical protein n=1 Tax=Acinetobacter sp. TaxID=472 RepID=UPI002584C464|nr:hypothetical protein [Acinetobacter sp.]